MKMSLFDKTKIPILSRALDVYALRQKVAASNIANIGSPGYRPQSVKFEEQLTDAIDNKAISPVLTDGRHIPVGPLTFPAPEVSPEQETGQPAGTGAASGVNDVDIDQEMLELAKNQIRFKFAARQLNETFKSIQASIKGES